MVIVAWRLLPGPGVRSARRLSGCWWLRRGDQLADHISGLPVQPGREVLPGWKPDKPQNRSAIGSLRPDYRQYHFSKITARPTAI